MKLFKTILRLVSKLEDNDKIREILEFPIKNLSGNVWNYLDEFKEFDKIQEIIFE